MDRAFLKYLNEIEKAYLVLPKALRIRVEAWVEKLASTGSNNVWKKHRNAYARLLLNMVTSRSLEEPFHVKPPDGPLPSFPMHLRNVNRNLLGPHESSFWREMYHKIQDNYGLDESIEQKSNDLVSNSYDSAASAGAVGGNATDSKNHTSFVNVSREIQNLNLLIKEQSQRIRLLEEQLTDERTKHELQLQRLHYSHRIEVGRLHTELQQVRESVFQEFHDSPQKVTTSKVNSMFNEKFGSATNDFKPKRVDETMDSVSFSSSTRLYSGAPLTSQTMNSTQAVAGIDTDPNNISASVYDITPRSYDYSASVIADNVPRTNQMPLKQSWIPETPMTETSAQKNNRSDISSEQQEVEFLKYLDQFQSEIKSIDKNIVATSSPYRTI